MCTRSLSLMLVLAACGQEPDFTTKQGLEVYDETGLYTRDEVEDSIRAVLTVIGGHGRTLDGLELHIEAAPLYYAGQEVGGLTYYGWGFRIHDNLRCWARSAFTHELCHHFQFTREDVDDPEHLSAHWWYHSGSETSVEGIALHNDIMEHCPDES